MYCSNCGSEIVKENAKFCPICGTPVKDPKVQTQNQEMKQPPKEGKKVKPKKEKKSSKPHKSKKKWIILLLVILLIGAAAVGAMVLKQKADKKNSADDTQAVTEETETVAKETEEITEETETATEDEEGLALEETETTEDSGDELIPGSNMSDAVLVPLGTKVFGKIAPNSDVWFSFATGDEEAAAYYATAVNATVGSKALSVKLYDEYGNDLSEYVYTEAEQDGAPVSVGGDGLTPNSIYYVTLHSENERTVEYSLIVKNPNDKTTAYKTVGCFSEAGGTSNAADGEIVAGTNQSAAAHLELDEKATGSIVQDGNVWFSFTTGEEEAIQYNVIAVNKTTESKKISCKVYNEYGNELTEYSYTCAEQDGSPATFSSNELLPNTTYYVNLQSQDDLRTVEYSVVVKSPNAKKKEQSKLIFEVPFEINETQVQFVANEATFIDEAKAKEVLKPVAEAVLKAPKHSILIAGTTATDGTQKSCVDLSVRRAEAVKNLLVETYNVPKSQIKTVGLGYKNDPFERGKDIDANGKFVESEGKKNRRVVIMDADDAIAKKLLKK